MGRWADGSILIHGLDPARCRAAGYWGLNKEKNAQKRGSEWSANKKEEGRRAIGQTKKGRGEGRQIEHAALPPALVAASSLPQRARLEHNHAP